MTRNRILLLAAVVAVATLSLGCPEPEPECTTDADCEVGLVCEEGACVDEACGEIYEPVCGEDGITYANECEARKAHVEVEYPGECPVECGGISGIPCPDGQICDLPAGMCNAADLLGLCVERPEVCPEVYDPVCGCDGQTYSNDCFRLMAGVQLDHDGECVG